MRTLANLHPAIGRTPRRLASANAGINSWATCSWRSPLRFGHGGGGPGLSRVFDCVGGRADRGLRGFLISTTGCCGWPSFVAFGAYFERACPLDGSGRTGEPVIYPTRPIRRQDLDLFARVAFELLCPRERTWEDTPGSMAAQPGDRYGARAPGSVEELRFALDLGRPSRAREEARSGVQPARWHLGEAPALLSPPAAPLLWV